MQPFETYSNLTTDVDDPNLKSYDSNEGHRLTPSGQLDPPLLRSSSRSKSYAGTPSEDKTESSYEQTVGEMKRLRSTRMDTHLSTTIKKARTSRIIDGPEGRSIRPGSAGVDGSHGRDQGFHIVEDRDANGDARTDLTFGNQDALTLDDIPRIVAAEHAKEQRPNAYKHARNQLIGSGGAQPKLHSGHQRDFSGGNELELNTVNDSSPLRTKRYFSELSALEYFIVRHVAVLSMQPLLEGHYNLEELLGLIETRKPTFWGKFGKAFKNDKAKNSKKKGIFGVGLDTVVERDGIESTHGIGPGALRVPAIIDETISAMHKMDMSVEGVFRKNGNIRGLKDLADKIDAKEVEVDLSKENPVQVAALLKRFLRELPDPLLTYKLYDLFITSQSMCFSVILEGMILTSSFRNRGCGEAEKSTASHLLSATEEPPRFTGDTLFFPFLGVFVLWNERWRKWESNGHPQSCDRHNSKYTQGEDPDCWHG